MSGSQQRGGCSRSMIKFDRYADPINLAYNRQKTYKTCHGGIFTCIAFLAILILLADNIFKIIIFDFKATYKLMPWNQSDQPEIPNGFQFNNQQLIVAHNFGSTNRTALPEDTIRNYFSAIYVQTQNVSSLQKNTFYNATPCDEIDKNLQSWAQVDTNGYYCQEMSSQDMITLQGFTGINNDTATSRFRLIIGTCDSLQNYTQNQDCVSEEESQEVIEYLKIYSNIWTNYFNPNYYIENGVSEYINKYFVDGLSQDAYQQRQFSIRQKNIKLEANWAFSFINPQSLALASVADDFYTILNVDTEKIEDAGGSKAQLVFEFTPNLLVVEETYVRDNIQLIFSLIGGYMYTIKNIGNAANRNMNKFQVDNSMISRLYSSGRKIEGHKNDIVENNQDTKSGRQELIDSLDMRQKWSYTCRDACCPPKGSGCSLRCCFCKKATLKDKLFEKGRVKLMDEIDILRIVKQLRINSFATDLILTPGQKNLVRWFDDYKLGINSDDNSSQTSDNDDKGSKFNEIKLGDEDDSQMQSFNQILSQSQKRKRRESFYEDHHLFVTDDLRSDAKEALTHFDCQENLIDSLVLAKVQGYEDMRTVMTQLGMDNRNVSIPTLEGYMGRLMKVSTVFDQPRTSINQDNLGFQNLLKESKGEFKIVKRNDARPVTVNPYKRNDI